MFQTIRRWRPALWLLGITLVALAVSLSWERATSYDDGGMGSVSFAVMFTLGLPFLVPAHMAAAAATHLGLRPEWFAWPVGLIVGCGFYLGLDQLISPRRDERRTADAPDA
jgi:hypothetical protein